MSDDRAAIWTSKYAPDSISQMSAQSAPLQQLQGYIKARKPGTVALLYGPQGSGKTTMVHVVARELGLELLEVNASDVRNESAILERVGPALKQQSLFSSGKIILFDEVDGLSGNSDRGGLATVLKLVKETPFPVVMTANDPWDSKFSELRRNAVMIPVHGLAYTSILPIVRRIAQNEGMSFDDDSLKALARRSGGDVRAAITDLQTLGVDVNTSSVDSLSQRDVGESILNALRIVLKTKDPALARRSLDAVSEDIDEIFLWLDENLAKEYRKPADIRRAYDLISRADVFRGRIRRWQHWRYLVYCYDLLGPGIALAKEEKYDGFIQLSPTQRLFAIWRSRSAMRDSLVQKLATMQHISKKMARKELALLKPVLVNSSFISDEERDWLAPSGLRKPAAKRAAKG